MLISILGLRTLYRDIESGIVVARLVRFRERDWMPGVRVVVERTWTVGVEAVEWLMLMG